MGKATIPRWRRKGLIMAPMLPRKLWSKHCQMPTPFLVDDSTCRLFYSSRDLDNRSHVFMVDVEPRPPWKVIKAYGSPVLTPSDLGKFDSEGVMPTSIIRRDGQLWLYYIGWSVRKDVPYHNAIGIAVSQDGGLSFERVKPGPVVGTGPNDPYFCGTADVIQQDDGYLMWYMSATEWRVLDGVPEPRYHLKKAVSDDGINWQQDGTVAVDYLTDDEGGIARATVQKMGENYFMWFCHRGISDYRGAGKNAYRLGVATSADGLEWTRAVDQPVLIGQPARGDFDCNMQCYPSVFTGPDGIYLFYNGSDFGQTGIGYASQEIYSEQG